MKEFQLFITCCLCLLFIIKNAAEVVESGVNKAAKYTDTWAVHVEGGERVARDLASKHGFVYLEEIMPDFYTFKHNHVSRRSIDPSPHHHETLAQESSVKWLEQQVIKTRVKRDKLFNDPKWPRMWYLNRGRGLDMNVQEAWRLGYTGEKVVVTILDDGIEKDHPDLKKNYDAAASYDVNGHDPDPQPRYDYSNENRHGTRCAGEVAAEANNNICSVGIAYESSIGGVRMLDGDVTDAVEAQSLALNPQHIDIYSASWGPDDDGRTVDGPAPLARHSFKNGISKGRGGKGSIFVWASGNGGRDHDSCNCDGYTNSIYTLSISSATEHGNVPWYSEACSSTLATTYSSGSGGERQIVTTDLRKGCTETHTGTSASAPLAAGVCALALDANPAMTWRDMQHIVVNTARPANLVADDWVINGVGRKVSHHFGYGLMDAGAMVKLARNWTNVPPQKICKVPSKPAARGIPINGVVHVSLETDGCQGTANEVLFLEHVEAVITLSATRRGEVEIYLTSPMGTKSTLLARRHRDTSTEGFNEWGFMTTHAWGETSRGTWTLEIKNSASASSLKNWSLVMHGTATHPQNGVNKPNSRPDRPVEGCPDGKYLFESLCYVKCPSGFYPANVSVPAPVNVTSENKRSPVSINVTPDVTHARAGNVTYVLMCVSCAQHCTSCYGPEVDDCTSCDDNFILTHNFTCVPSSLNPFDLHQFITSHQDAAFVALALALCVLAVAGFLLVFGLLQMRSHGRACFSSRGHESSTLRVDAKGKENPEFTAQGSPLLEDTDSS